MRAKNILIPTAIAMLFSFASSSAQIQYLTLKQPNGTVFKAIERGDEWLHFFETPDGRIVRRGPNGYFQYFTINANGEFVATGLRAGIDAALTVPVRPYDIPEVRRALVQKLDGYNTAAENNREVFLRRQRGGLAPRLQEKPGGTSPIIQQELTLSMGVILVEFNGRPHYTGGNRPNGYTVSDFESMLFSDNQYNGLSPDGEQVFGSMRDYFEYQSHGLLHITGQIINPNVNGIPTWLDIGSSLPYDEQYESLFLLNDAVNYATLIGWNCNYDIVGVLVSQDDWTWYAGGVAWFRDDYTAGDFVSNFDFANWMGGFVFNERNAAEYRNSSNATFSHIGLIGHEVFHVLGWGIYNVLGEGGEIWIHAEQGDWSFMNVGYRTGPLRKDECPGDLDAVTKTVMEWANPTSINSTLTNEPIQYLEFDNNPSANFDFYRFEDPGSSEEFIVENRKYSGFNSYLPEWWQAGVKGGLLVWWRSGQVREIRRADNDNDVFPDPLPLVSDGDLGDPFPGSSNNFQISMATTPNTQNFGGNRTGFAITNISASPTTMTAILHQSYLASNSTNATTSNNSRKLVRESSGAYHLVFESDGETYYQNSIDGGTSWSNYFRLSGGNNGHGFPCIAERNGNLYVVWQRLIGGTYSLFFRKYASGVWSSNTILATGIAASNDLLPVITSPASGKLMIVFRGASTLRYRVSNDDGSSWSTGANVPATAANDNAPTLAPTTTYWGSNTRSCLAYALNNGATSTIYYQYYRHGPDSSEIWSARKDLSQIVPGTYYNHQKPSMAPSGSASNKRLHLVWETWTAADPRWRVVIHRKATDWFTWPNVYSATYYEQQTAPSITGLYGETAKLLFQTTVGSPLIYKMHYDGAYWGSPVYVGPGTNPSASMGQTQAKYVYTGTAVSSPYEIKISSETMSKSNEQDVAYRRSIAVIDTFSGAWLEIRLDELSVTTASGEEFSIPFEEAKEDEQTLTPANAFGNLSSREVMIPAEAESLRVKATLGAEGLSAIRNAATPIGIEISLAANGGAAVRLPLAAITQERLARTKPAWSIALAAFKGKSMKLRFEVSGIAAKPSLIASLGHIYEAAEGNVLKALEESVHDVVPHDYVIDNYPNPFNPATQIRFALPEENFVALRIYNVQGQMVRELLHATRPAGEYSVSWDGRDQRGLAVASGVYFLRLQAGRIVKSHKLMLMR